MANRRNRRARTSRVVRDNRIFDIYITVDGYPAGRRDAYYRRRLTGAPRYTGLHSGLAAFRAAHA